MPKKGDIKNLKLDPEEIKVTEGKFSKGFASKKKTAELIVKMNEAKFLKGITGGRKRKYTPEALLKKINEFFLSNTIFQEIKDKDDNIVDYVFLRMQGISIEGLCSFLEITYQSYREMLTTKKYGEICMKAKQKIMDSYIVGGLEGYYNPKVASTIINMQMQNERIEEDKGAGESNLFQKIEINIIKNVPNEEKGDDRNILELN